MHISIFLALVCAAPSALAQVDLWTAGAAVPNHPTVKIPVKVQCDFVWQDNLDVSQFTVTEDGIPQSPLSLLCFPPANRSAIALAMVGDRRSIMPGWGTAKMKSAYKGFVNAFKSWSGVPDKGSVFGDPGPAQALTTDKPTLLGAIDALNASGGFSLGVITNAINDLLANGGSADKQVVITACVDQPIYPSVPEVLALTAAYNNAQSAGVIFNTIFVYTNPAIPYINDAIVQLLKSFAVNTGGHYNLCGSEVILRATYLTLVTNLLTEIPFCRLTYQSKVACPDGRNRQVIVTWSGCSGADSDTLYYSAPNDPSAIRPSQFALGSAVVNGRQQTQIPCAMTSPYPEVVLYPFIMTLTFNPALLTLKSVETSGDLAEGFTPFINPNAGGAVVNFLGPPKIILGSGALCHLTFVAGDPDTDTSAQVGIASVSFGGGCLKQDSIRQGAIRIIARKPVLALQCAADSPVLWDSTTFAYTPGLINASVAISNSGNRGARNVRATIILPAGIELASGAATQFLSPSTLDSSSSASLAWMLRPLERLTSDTLLICFDVASDNHATLRCCAKVFVQERGPLLRITCSADSITVQNNSYVPMPFAVRALVLNAGGMRAQPLTAEIRLPPGLRLAAGDTARKKVSPDALRNGQSGSVGWLLTHPESAEDSTFDIVVCAQSPNAQEACCSLQVRIPKVNAPRMETVCSAPDSLQFSASAGDYLPNPFTVTVSTKNSGGLPAQDVRAVIILPTELLLDPSSQKDTVAFSPSLIPPNSTAGGISWQVRAQKQGTARQVIIRFRIIGTNFGDVDCERAIFLPKAGSAALTCGLSLPDSLAVRSDGMDYLPNPFRATCTLSNAGFVTSGYLLATIVLPPDLQSQSPLTQAVGGGTLASGGQAQLAWDILALPGAALRADRISVVVSEDSLPRTLCADTIRVPKLAQSIRLTCAGPDTIHYDRSNGVYSPDPFPVTVRILNAGSLVANNVTATILLPPELALAAGSPTIPVAPLIAPLDAAQAAWSLRVLPQSGSVSAVVTIRVSADSLPAIECRKIVIIEGQSLAQLSCSLELPAALPFTGGDYAPNPFPLRVHVRNTGATTVANISALLLTPADMAIDISDQSLKQVTPAALAPGDTALATFLVHVYPHAAARSDTLLVSLVSSAAPATFCAGAVDVAKALRPKLEILCSAPDSVRYDATTRKYAPDPFAVNVSIRNTGDATASSVYGIISLSGGLRLSDAAQKFAAPSTIAPGGSGSVAWLVSPIKESVAHTDTIFIRVRSDEFGIVETTCLAIVRSEAVTAPILSLACAVPESLAFSGGAYSPSQIVARATVTNTGVPASAQTTIAIHLPPDLRLAAGEQQIKTAGSGTLSANESQTVQWLLDVAPRGVEERAPVCFTAQALNADSAECCDDIFIPGKSRPGVALACDAPAALAVDSASGAYSPSPFAYGIRVTNTGSDTLRNVVSLLILPSGIDPVAGGTFKLIAAALAPGDTASAAYQLLARARLQGDSLLLLARITADQVGETYCARQIFIPALNQGPRLDIACASGIDTITFTPQSGTAIPASLRIGSVMTNLGASTIPRASAEILLPTGLSLLGGQGPSLDLIDLSPGPSNARSVAWDVTAARPSRDTLVAARIRFMAAGAVERECSSFVQILVRGSLPHIFISEDLLVSADRTFDLPVWIDTRGMTLEDARIEIQYDTARLAFQSLDLLPDQRGKWLQPDISVRPGVIDILMRSIGGYSAALPLFALRFHSESFPPGEEFRLVKTDISFAAGEVNNGSLNAETTGRSISIAGSCLAPLAAGSGFALMQNVPNPANPSARIYYAIPRDGRVLLTLHDLFGRRLMTLVDAPESAGVHSATADVSTLPGGIYFYRLESGAGVLIRKMIVAK